MIPPAPSRHSGYLVFVCLILLACTVSVHAAPDTRGAPSEPVVYLSMNEASGRYTLDLSGNGNSGEIHNASRIAAGACGEALFFNGGDSYVAIPYRTSNHPEKELTVDLWFAVDSYDRQVLVSTYHNGGYRIAFDDGNDLWWTVNTAKGDVSVPVQHEYIPLHRWHHVAGTYDGKVSRIYLDGILRNVANGTGPIRYTYQNDVMFGVDAGTGKEPDPQCNGYFRGGLDEIRLYRNALSYGQVMDDRFSCPQEPRVIEFTPSARTLPEECSGLSSAFTISGSGQETKKIIVPSPDKSAFLNVHIPAGSTLSVDVADAYAPVYPDAWYIEIGDSSGTRLTRSVAFPNMLNAPTEAVIPSGNATVQIRYFDGTNRFPASAYVTLRSTAPPPPPVLPSTPIFANPIIVIYTASWATLVAIILVIFWLHRRNKNKTS